MRRAARRSGISRPAQEGCPAGRSTTRGLFCWLGVCVDFGEKGGLVDVCVCVCVLWKGGGGGGRCVRVWWWLCSFLVGHSANTDGRDSAEWKEREEEHGGPINQSAQSR
jgi:hypothetical protein